MRLKILGSSSAGNCYLLEACNGETLVVEAGVSFEQVKKAMGFDLGRIAGCVISHEHGDHAKYVRRYAEAYIPVLMSAGTYNSLGLHGCHSARAVRASSWTRLGGFEVMPFPVQHDACEPFGWVIFHEESGYVLFATDTYYLKYAFNGLSNIMLECNYRLDILRRNVELGHIDRKRYERTVQSHMSYETCRDTLLANDLSKVNNIVLIHLSSLNSDAGAFVEGIKAATGKENVFAAAPGMEIDFGKTPY